MKKRNIIYIYISIFILSIGASFAWYVWKGTDVNVSVQFSSLTPYLNHAIYYEDDEGNKTATSTEDTTKQVMVFQTIEEGKNLNVYGDIYIKITSAESENLFKSSGFVWELSSRTTTELGSVVENPISSGNFVGEHVTEDNENGIPAALNIPIDDNTEYVLKITAPGENDYTNIDISGLSIVTTQEASRATAPTDINNWSETNDIYVRSITYSVGKINTIDLYSSLYPITGYIISNTEATSSTSGWITTGFTSAESSNEPGYVASVTGLTVPIDSTGSYVCVKNSNNDVSCKRIAYQADILPEGNEPSASLCKDVTYNGSAQNLTSVTGGTNYTLSGYSHTNVSTDGDYNSTKKGYPITATTTSGYVWSNGTNTLTFYCSMKPKSVTIPTSPTAKTYNAETQSSGITTPNGASIVTANSTISAINANTTGYSIEYQLTSNTNYVWSDDTTTNKTVKWIINPYNLSNSTIEDIDTQYYTGNAITPEPTVTVPIPSGSSTTLIKNTDFDYSYSNNTAVGDATVVITGKGNYTGTNSKTFTISYSDFTITLDNQSATSTGTATIYGRYAKGVYLDSNRTNQMTTSANPITVPTKTGYTFGGYYTAENGSGTQLIDANGKITSSFTNTLYDSDVTLYANWEAKKVKITLNSGDGTGGTSYIYYRYGTNKYYSDDSLSTEITSVTLPTLSNSVWCMGYYSGQNGAGTRYTNGAAPGSTASIINNLYNAFTEDTPLYAWFPHFGVYKTIDDTSFVKATNTLQDAFDYAKDNSCAENNTCEKISILRPTTQEGATNSGEVTLSSTSSARTLTMTGAITNTGNLTIKGSAVITSSTAAHNLIDSSGTLTVESGSLSKTVNSTITSDGSTTYYYTIRSSGTLNISGGTISANTRALLVTGSNVATITDGTITSENGNPVMISSGFTGTLNISGGTITAEAANAAVYQNGSATVNISGGTITSTGSTGVYNNTDSTINISGGSITGGANGVHNNSTGTFNITGGTITGNNYAIVNHSTGTITLGDNDDSAIGKTSNPKVVCTHASNYAVYINSGTFNFYDGQIYSKTKDKEIYGTVAAVPTGFYIFKSTATTTYNSADYYYAMPFNRYTIALSPYATNLTSTCVADSEFTSTGTSKIYEYYGAYQMTGTLSELSGFSLSATRSETASYMYSIDNPITVPECNNAGFMGYYTTSTGSGGSKIIDANGFLTSNASKTLFDTSSCSSTSVNGVCDDYKLYARYGFYEVKNGTTLVGVYTTLQSAYDASSDGYTIKILTSNRQTVATSDDTITIGKNLTLDTNGKTLNMRSKLIISEGKTLTVKGGGIIQAYVDSSDSSNTYTGYIFDVNSGGKLNVSDGTTIKTTSSSSGYMIANSGTTNIYGFSLIQSSSSSYYTIYNRSSGVMNIYDTSSIESTAYRAILNYGDLDIYGSSTVTASAYAIYNGNYNDTGSYNTVLRIYSGTIESTASYGILNYGVNTECIITGGTIIGATWGIVNSSSNWSGTLTLGTQDENYSTTKPTVVSKSTTTSHYAIQASTSNTSGTFNFYDGQLYSKNLNKQIYAASESDITTESGFYVYKYTTTTTYDEEDYYRAIPYNRYKINLDVYSSSTLCDTETEVTTRGSTAIYEYYNQAFSTSNSRASTYFMDSSTNPITVPQCSNATFKGYYTATSGGTQYINKNGYLASADNTHFTDEGTLYARWTAATLGFDDKELSTYYSSESRTLSLVKPTSGSGTYTYSEVSEANISGTSTSYFSLSGATITVAADTPTGTYTYVVQAKDSSTSVTENATYTIIVGAIGYTTSSGTSYCNSMKTAAKYVKSGGTITFYKDFSGSGAEFAKNATINTNGKTMTITSPGSEYSDGTGLYINSDITIKGSGKITTSSSMALIWIESGDSLTLQSATLENKSTDRGAVGVNDGSTLTVTSGSIIAEHIGINTNGTVTINGGTIKSNQKIAIFNGINTNPINITGGTISGHDCALMASANTTGSYDTATDLISTQQVNISGGTLSSTSSNGQGIVNASGNIELNISGGTISGYYGMSLAAGTTYLKGTSSSKVYVESKLNTAIDIGGKANLYIGDTSTTSSTATAGYNLVAGNEWGIYGSSASISKLYAGGHVYGKGGGGYAIGLQDSATLSLYGGVLYGNKTELYTTDGSILSVRKYSTTSNIYRTGTWVKGQSATYQFQTDSSSITYSTGSKRSS